MALAAEVTHARKRIFRDGYDISFGELVSLYEKDELVIQPEYQRLFRWDQTQKTRFIESLLLNIPIPPIFVFSDSSGRWELVDGLQRVSTVLEFMGLRRDAEGHLVAPFACDGTALLPSLQGTRWPLPEQGNDDEAFVLPQGDESGLLVDIADGEQPLYLPLPLQLTIRRSRIRVEILGQETDAHAKYELFQRLNSGGTNLSEQELRNCVIVSINKKAFDHIKTMSGDANFLRLAKVGEERAKRQYLLELVVRFIVLRNFPYQQGLDVHEYLDNGMVVIAEDSSFDWVLESHSFALTMQSLMQSVGENAFLKNARFSLAMYEFITLGLSKAIDRAGGGLDDVFVRNKVEEAPNLPAAQKYSGMGVRGTQRLASFVVPLAEAYFAQAAS